MKNYKLNLKELAHYIIGGLILINLWLPTMNFFQNNIWLTGTAWILESIIVDQILHVIIKGEKISIV